MAFPILQFGTSRFLQAHFDLFVDQGYAEGSSEGKIAVVQTTSSPDSARRLAFFDTGQPYTVRVRGLGGEKLVDQEVRPTWASRARSRPSSPSCCTPAFAPAGRRRP